MEFRGKVKSIGLDMVSNLYQITFESEENLTERYRELEGKDLAIEAKCYKRKRSLDANAYFWKLTTEIAKVLRSSNDEVYDALLKRYGVSAYVIIHEALVDRFKQSWKHIEVLGAVRVGGSEGIQVRCIFGSSTYNTAEMSRLIDGTVSEAKELGIETLAPLELARIKEMWGV